MHYTHRPLEWDEWLRAAWGPELYDELRGLAVGDTRPDMAAILERLKAMAA